MILPKLFSVFAALCAIAAPSYAASISGEWSGKQYSFEQGANTAWTGRWGDDHIFLSAYAQALLGGINDAPFGASFYADHVVLGDTDCGHFRIGIYYGFEVSGDLCGHPIDLGRHASMQAAVRAEIALVIDTLLQPFPYPARSTLRADYEPYVTEWLDY